MFRKKYFVNIQEGLKHFFKYIAFKFSCAWIFRRHLFMLRKLKQRYIEIWILKVNSVQEVCGKCFAVHVLKFEILQITWKNQTKNIRLLVFSFSPIDLAFWCFLFCFFHVVCKISNFDMWSTKYLAQASCTELTLLLQKGLILRDLNSQCSLIQKVVEIRIFYNSYFDDAI